MKRLFFGLLMALTLAFSGGAALTSAASSSPARGPGGGGVGGQITAVSGTTITVKTHDRTATIATTSSTSFTLDGAASTLSAMTSGLYVRAEGSKATDGSFTASKISASTSAPTAPAKGGPRGNGVGGQITAVSGTTITVKTHDRTATIATSSSTSFTLDGAASTLSAMTSGLYLRAEGSKATDGSFTASKVSASTSAPTPPAQGGPRGHGNGVGGQITAVSGTTITVTTRQGSATIATSSSTTFTLDGATSSLSAMTSGLYVRAEGSKATDGSFTASKVSASTKAPTPPTKQ